MGNACCGSSYAYDRPPCLEYATLSKPGWPSCQNPVAFRSVLDRLGSIFSDRQQFCMQGVGSDECHEESMNAVGYGECGVVGRYVCDPPTGGAHAIRPDGGCAASPSLAASTAALLRLRRVGAVEAVTTSALVRSLMVA